MLVLVMAGGVPTLESVSEGAEGPAGMRTKKVLAVQDGGVYSAAYTAPDGTLVEGQAAMARYYSAEGSAPGSAPGVQYQVDPKNMAAPQPGSAPVYQAADGSWVYQAPTAGAPGYHQPGTAPAQGGVPVYPGATQGTYIPTGQAPTGTYSAMAAQGQHQQVAQYQGQPQATAAPGGKPVPGQQPQYAAPAQQVRWTSDSSKAAFHIRRWPTGLDDASCCVPRTPPSRPLPRCRRRLPRVKVAGGSVSAAGQVLSSLNPPRHLKSSTCRHPRPLPHRSSMSRHRLHRLRR